MILKWGKLERGIVDTVDTESLVPTNYFLRKINMTVD